LTTLPIGWSISLPPMRARHLLFVGLAVLGASGSTSCSDPVHSDAVDALGPEKAGVREGPTHRPGQHCLTCHGGLGPGSPEFSIAGTIYSARGVQEPLSGVTVSLVDATSAKRTVTSNEVGNFYIAVDTWAPAYPVRVTLEDSRADEKGQKEMVTPIGRNGGCAFCHYGTDTDPSHMPPVFLRQKAL
jgi:hypothetical protein